MLKAKKERDIKKNEKKKKPTTQMETNGRRLRTLIASCNFVRQGDKQIKKLSAGVMLFLAKRICKWSITISSIISKCFFMIVIQCVIYNILFNERPGDKKEKKKKRHTYPHNESEMGTCT